MPLFARHQNYRFVYFQITVDRRFFKKLEFINFFKGSIAKFEEVFENLSTKSTTLTELVLNGIKSFVMFEYQQRFAKHLRRFTSLKRLRIECQEFEISRTFLDSVFELTGLVHLQLRVKFIPDYFFKEYIPSLKKVKINY
jgi:hypothetical protein